MLLRQIKGYRHPEYMMTMVEAGLTEAVVTDQGRVTGARFEIYQPAGPISAEEGREFGGELKLEVVNEDGELLNQGSEPGENVTITPGGLPTVVDFNMADDNVTFPLGAKGNTARLVLNAGPRVLVEGLTLDDFINVNIRGDPESRQKLSEDRVRDIARQVVQSELDDRAVGNRGGGTGGGASGSGSGGSGQQRSRAPDAGNPFLRFLPWT